MVATARSAPSGTARVGNGLADPYVHGIVKRALVVFLVAALVVVAAAFAATPYGTWKGKLLDPKVTGAGVPPQERVPISAFPAATVVVNSASVQARFTGHTMAAHDAPDATSTCSMRFRFSSAADGWRLYQVVGRAVLVQGIASGGMPDLSPCSYAGPTGSAIRVRPVPGAMLKVEFSQFYRQGERFYAGLRGYLRR